MEHHPNKLQPKIYHLEGDIYLVPCIANFNTNAFQALCTPLGTDNLVKQVHKRQSWTPEEDEYLLQIIEARGAKEWASIAKEINFILYEGKNVRQGRQCRERWFNHVDPNLNKGEWSLEEDIYLVEAEMEYGNKWSDIAKGLTGRTENSVKNRFKSLIKKARKDWPDGTNLTNAVLAELKQTVIENKHGSSIEIVSPMLTNQTVFSPLFGTSPPSGGYNPNSGLINSVRNCLFEEIEMDVMDLELIGCDNEFFDIEMSETTPSPSIFLRSL